MNTNTNDEERIITSYWKYIRTKGIEKKVRCDKEGNIIGTIYKNLIQISSKNGILDSKG